MASKKPKSIAIYGKGGIGKSTTTSNISAALATSGLKVLQMGCDPKSDSTATLRGGNPIPTILSLLRQHKNVRLSDVVFTGFGGVSCVEAGGPAPGVGCAGRGIITAVELLKSLHVFEELDIDVIIYDVLGDVVCGGFAVPVREGIAETVFTVSSADFMAIYAANNLFRGIQRFSNSGGALLGGIIANSINSDFARDLVDDFAGETKTDVVEYVPRSVTVTQSELSGKTTIEGAPDSEQAAIYRRLAERVYTLQNPVTPSPLDEAALTSWARRWADIILAMESGEVRPAGASI